ncbi:MAG: regulatory protein RecX [Actinomycetes bacterium]
MSRRPAPGRRTRRGAGGLGGSPRLDPAATLPDRPAGGPTPGSGADDGPDANPESVARTILLRKLTAAPRTRAQLAADLRRRAVPDDVAERVLDRFVEVGLINDAAFADEWVRSRHATRGLSRRALAHELRTKGVDDELAAAALDRLDDDDERSAAQALVAKRLPSLRGHDTQVQTRRLVGMLARKGYPGGLAMQVVRAAVAGQQPFAAADTAVDEDLDADLDAGLDTGPG